MKLKLQAMSEWFKDSSDVVTDAAEVALESGFLRDTIKDLGQVGGVAGVLLKLGARVLPDLTPEDHEKRVAHVAARAFTRSFNAAMGSRAAQVNQEKWQQHLDRGSVKVRAQEALHGSFTWLSVFTAHGMRQSSDWPIVSGLAELGKAWASLAGIEEPALREVADEVARGVAGELDSLMAEPEMERAIKEISGRIAVEGLALVAEMQSGLDDWLLFQETPQSALYIPARVKVADLKTDSYPSDWKRVEQDSRPAHEVLLDALRNRERRLVVIEGDMGVGKSCLMRVVAAELSRQYHTGGRAPLFARWRELYDKDDLSGALQDYIRETYKVPLLNLETRENVAYLMDGFDEMASHDDGHVRECFERLLDLAAPEGALVVAMRTPVITEGLRSQWKRKDALVVQVQDFADEDIEKWAGKWNAHTGAAVTGDALRSLVGERRVPSPDDEASSGVANNPLLLYMLARDVHPNRAPGARPLSRSEVFRIFVDQTISGKVATSGEDFPADIGEYRLILQELAAIASWPDCKSACPEYAVDRVLPQDIRAKLQLPALRTAFVLHFFEPSGAGKFEFQPEGFRQYLLAEWSVRNHLDAAFPLGPGAAHPLCRASHAALNWLAQLELQGDERSFHNDIWEELGRLSREKPKDLRERLKGFAREVDEDEGPALLEQLYQHVRARAESPPAERLTDEKIGSPQGQEVPPALDDLRLVVNYWDQCLIATFGLYRGLGKHLGDERVAVFPNDPYALHRYLRTRDAVRGHDWGPRLDLSRLGLTGADLSGAGLSGANLIGADLIGADLAVAELSGADLSEADLSEANLTAADLALAQLCAADLPKAKLSGAKLSGANLSEANLSEANLGEAHLFVASLRSTDLSGADLSGADLTGADLTLATMPPNWREMTEGTPWFMPDGSRPDEPDEADEAPPQEGDRP